MRRCPLAVTQKSHSGSSLTLGIMSAPVPSWRSGRCQRIARYFSKWPRRGRMSPDACGEALAKSSEYQVLCVQVLRAADRTLRDIAFRLRAPRFGGVEPFEARMVSGGGVLIRATFAAA